MRKDYRWFKKISSAEHISQMPSLSVCMMVQNVEKTLPVALESLNHIYDELIIVDGGSNDSTCEIAASYDAEVIHSPWSGNHSHQRNVYLKSVKTDWVFVLDGDEFIDIQTVEFLQLLKDTNYRLESDNFWIPRKWIPSSNKHHYISNPPHYPDFQRRLFKYNTGIVYTGQIHEIIQNLAHPGFNLNDLSIYHLDLFVNDEETRRNKVRKYSKTDARSGGRSYYLPDSRTIQTTEWDYNTIYSSTRKLIDDMNFENKLPTSELNNLISPEIKNDEFYTIIQELARTEDIKTVLEIGSSSGGGSTEAFVTGLRDNPNQPQLFCMEVSQPRFAELSKRYEQDKFVKCYNVSSVAIEEFPDQSEVINFYHNSNSDLKKYPLAQVLGWLQQDIEYVRNTGVSANGIRQIKQDNQIDDFDLVLIDGSEFTGISELKEVYGSKFILLDDITTFKNHTNHQQLLADPNYILISQNTDVRNGYSIFKRLSESGDNLAPHEISERRLLKKLVKPGMLVLDVGANIGDYAIILSRLVGSLGTVHTFEPASSTFVKLEERLKQSKCHNVQAHQKATYSENIPIVFNEFPEDFSVWNSIGRPEMLNPNGSGEYVPIVKTETVDGITLDSFCKDHGIEKIDYLKIDVEGAESDTLEGTIDLLRNQKIGYIQFEISQKMLEGLDRTAIATFDILRKHG
jgi:FkbM family methyltransferase